jgi:hypothetical protein
MEHGLLDELFRYARNYHGALAQYAAMMRAGGDIEDSAQSIIGASVRYRLAIQRLLDANDTKSLAIVSSRGRLERLHRVLATTSHRYNLMKSPPGRADREGRQAIASSRSMSCRTVS